MDQTVTYITAISVLAPVYSAFACGLLVGLSHHNCLTQEEKKLKRILLVYLFLSALGWYVTYSYQYRPTLFVWLNVACLLSYTLPSIFFYRIVRFLTRLGQQEDFPVWHYLLPGALTAVLLIWSFFVPLDVQLEIVRGKAEVFPAGYEAYARFFTIKPALRFITGIIYYILTILLLIHYYEKASGKDTLIRKPAQWVVFLVAISLASLLSSLLPTLMPRSRLLHSVWIQCVALSIATQHVLLSFHIIRRKYWLYILSPGEMKCIEKKQLPSPTLTLTPIPTPRPALKPRPTRHRSRKKPQAPAKRIRRSHSGKLSRERVEMFFRTEKPYLNPDYKIADFVEDMDVNRTVLSAFINQTYNMNFNRYINRWRLEELRELSAMPENKNRPIGLLLPKAGFNNYRTYSRAVTAEFKAAKTKGKENSGTESRAKQKGGKS